MSRNKYTPEFKAKIVLEVIEGDREAWRDAHEEAKSIMRLARLRRI